MRIVTLFILLVVFVIIGYWLHGKHLKTPEPVKTTTTEYNTSTQIPVTTIMANQQKKIQEFIDSKNPSGIMIFIKDGNHYIQYCSQKDQRHSIIYVEKKNPAVKGLKRWSINPAMISTPYTIIFNHGNIILRSHGIICDY